MKREEEQCGLNHFYNTINSEKQTKIYQFLRQMEKFA